jgi:hypothetical protein
MMVKRSLFGALVALVVSGCAAPVDPEVKFTPTPVQSYRFDIAFQDVPGPVTKIRAMAFYRADNIPCAKPQPLSGAVLPPEHRLQLKLEKVNDTQYRAVFHRDALIDEDYFGIGVCKWQLQNIALYFSSPTTDFTASLSAPSEKDTRVQVEEYFLNRDYAEKPEVMNIVFGEKAGYYLPEMGEQFKVTLSAERR